MTIFHSAILKGEYLSDCGKINAITFNFMNFRILAFLFLLAFNVSSYPQNTRYQSFGNKKEIVYDFGVSSGGTWLVLPQSNDILIYGIKTSEIVHTFKGGHTRQVLTVDLSADSSVVASGGKDSLLNIWNVNDQVIKMTYKLPGVVIITRFSPDQKYLAAGTAHGEVRVYNIATGSLEYQSDFPGNDITTLGFSRDNKLFVFAGSDKTIHVLSALSWKPMTELTEHTDWVRDLVFSRDSSKMVSCGDDCNMILWDITKSQSIYKSGILKTNSGWMCSTDIHNDGKTCVFGGLDGNIGIPDSPLLYHFHLKNTIQKIRFLPNTGSTMIILAATRGKGLIMINAKNMKLLKNKWWNTLLI
jgi:WD40 repeat protein